MSPLMWLLMVVLGLYVGMCVDRTFRAKRQEEASSRRRWSEYAEMAARNTERWHTR